MKLFIVLFMGLLCAPAYSQEDCKWVPTGDCTTSMSCPECPECPKAKKCPKAKAKKCPKTTVQTKYVNVPVDKIQYRYVDRASPAPTHAFGLLMGIGPHGVKRVYYDTEERPQEYVFRRDDGMLVGLQYQWMFAPSWIVSGMAISNATYMGGIHYTK